MSDQQQQQPEHDKGDINLEQSPPPLFFKVYKPPSDTANLSQLEPLPDSFFEPTAAELQAAYASQTRRREELIDAPMKTQAIRDKEDKIKRNRWPNTRIRIKFPDQTIVERDFPSADKIKSVYVFVRSALISEAQSDKFILYQPPKRDLKVSDPQVKHLSLAELQLAPSSVLLLRFESDAYNSSTLPPPLLPQILEAATQLPLSAPAEPKKPETSNAKSSSTASSSGVEKKVPKWFKMGKR